MRGDLGLVGDKHDRLSFGVERRKNTHDLFAGLGVESAGRLVGQHEGRLDHDGSRYGDSLFLSPGKLVRLILDLLEQTDAIESSFSSRFAFFGRNPLVHERQHDLLQDVQSRNQAIVLENETDFVSSDRGFFAFGEARDIVSLKKIFSGGLGIEKSDNVHEGRFSRSGCPHDRQKIPLSDL
jgi:hypothetical protein